MSNSPEVLTTRWSSPVRIGDYLAGVLRDHDARPPDAPGVYLVSERAWQESPNRQAGVIYAGQASYLRYRIGQLLSDLFGFTGDVDGEAYQHRGGHWLWHRYCVGHNVEPANLYVAWRSGCECLDCAEAELVEFIPIELKWRLARRCTRHSFPLHLALNWPATRSAHAETERLIRISKN